MASVGISYSWFPTNGLSCTDCRNPVVTAVDSIIYYVTVTDSNGCSNTDSIRINVEKNCDDLFVPNAFSPNKDAENDILYVHAKCAREIKFTIFNRWGEKVFETTDISKGWDGKFNNKDLNAGVFVYYLEGFLFTNEKINRKGNITLLR